MAKAQAPSPVKLIIGIITSSDGILSQAKEKLQRKFGPIDYASQPIPFNYTDYYAQEMGQGLLRQFLSFKRLIGPGQLAGIKLYTNKLEQAFSRQQNKLARAINLDPGYICASRLVLASCKDFAHRIYLERGIFAEVTLQFRQGSFVPLAWTYPDYQSQEYTQVFLAVRKMYMQQINT